MRLARLGDSWVVAINDSTAVDVTDLLGPPTTESWRSLCAQWPAARSSLEAALLDRTSTPLDPRRCAAPVVGPSKIVGLLGNDVERGAGEDDQLDLFLKAPSALVGPSGTITLPATDDPTTPARVVPECELAVVISRGGRDLDAGQAGSHVLGYSIALDLTARGPGERSRRKSHDTFCPLGPWLVTAEDVADADDLGVRLWVGDDLCQDWSTSAMVCRVAETVAFVSRSVTLEPGDVVLTGAPKMSRVLAPGDVLRGEIDGLGMLEISVSERPVSERV